MHSFYILLQVLKVLLLKIYKTQLPDLILLMLFYISRYYFPQLFRTSFNIIRKKIFITKFPFLTDSLNPPPT